MDLHLIKMIHWNGQSTFQIPAYYTTTPLSSNRSEKYKIVTFFSGNVRIELGFEQTNEFRVVYANEFDKYARQNYSFNQTIRPTDISDECMGS